MTNCILTFLLDTHVLSLSVNRLNCIGLYLECKHSRQNVRVHINTVCDTWNQMLLRCI